MGGIAGFVASRSHGPEVLRAMLGTLRHRGPDGESQYVEGGFSVAACILALERPEPAVFVDGDVVLAFDGEVHNLDEVRADLLARGRRLATASCGEVLCALWREHGPELVHRLDGMIAMALWLRRPRRLILVRDPAGGKPLCYAPLPGGGLAFGSEPRALLRHPGVDRTLDLQAVWDMPTFLWPPEPSTGFRAIRVLPPGHLLASSMGRHVVRRLLPRPSASGAEQLRGPDLTAEVRRRTAAAVERRSQGAGALGSLLSGGLDSSVIVALAAAGRVPLHTFCVGYDTVGEPRHRVAEESHLAAALARRFGTRHRTVRLTAARARLVLEDLFEHCDEPFALSSGLGILAVAREARELGIRALLSGDGADELFLGFPSYARPETVSAALGGTPFDAEALAAGPRSERLRWLEGYRRALAGRYYASENEKAELFHPDLAAGVRTSLRWLAQEGEDILTPRHYHRGWYGFYLANESLRKLDRMTAACSVNGRAPFAAPELLELAPALQREQMARGGRRKLVLREAFASLLPKEVLERRKQGFSLPIDVWLRDSWPDLLERALGPESALHRHGWIRNDALDRARTLLADPKRSHGHTLLCFVALDRWLEKVC